MTRKDEYATVVYLRDRTLEELEKAKEEYKEIEEHMDLDDKTQHSHRLSNGKFNRDYIIREALEYFNREYTE